MKKKAAFIDHSFHKKTRSTDFIKEILSKEFELTYYYDESWNGGQNISIEDLRDNYYEYVFYFQFIHNVRHIKKIKHSNIVFFPMEDSTLNFSNLKWLEYEQVPIKVVCFSKKLFCKLRELNINCIWVKYFIDPYSVQEVSDYSLKRVYFWNRTQEINWELIKKVLGNKEIASLDYIALPDPNNKITLPGKNDITKYNIKIYDAFLEKNEYENIVSNDNIYIAPRKYEGIGMSFLEALARGQCVIAPNCMTMNEYIENGVNGYLYELEDKTEIDLTNFELVAKEGRRRAFIGYNEWKEKEREIINFILEKTERSSIASKVSLFLKIKHLQIKRMWNQNYELKK